MTMFILAYFTEGCTNLPRDATSVQLHLEGSLPVFLGKPIVTCDLPGGGGGSGPSVPISGSAHGCTTTKQLHGPCLHSLLMSDHL